ncbi:Os07g0522400 [Oryza sativa Japonica Group]|uniref:Os07g0522400 protein n=1 Tax=Oryza sativa subsp. japonica TaxID=39947 RepID=A0A0N7KNJ8_ORYSJ|nr:Os07g0522400 [Oryza sativa Japonica Group]
MPAGRRVPAAEVGRARRCASRRQEAVRPRWRELGLGKAGRPAAGARGRAPLHCHGAVGTREGEQAGRRREGQCTVAAPSGLGKGAGWPPREGQSAVAPSRPHGTRERWRRHQASERRRMRV